MCEFRYHPLSMREPTICLVNVSTHSFQSISCIRFECPLGRRMKCVKCQTFVDNCAGFETKRRRRSKQERNSSVIQWVVDFVVSKRDFSYSNAKSFLFLFIRHSFRFIGCWKMFTINFHLSFSTNTKRTKHCQTCQK